MTHEKPPEPEATPEKPLPQIRDSTGLLLKPGVTQEMVDKSIKQGEELSRKIREFFKDGVDLSGQDTP